MRLGQVSLVVATRAAIGVASVAVLLTVVLAACGKDDAPVTADEAPQEEQHQHDAEATPHGHEGDEGLALGPETDSETVYPGALCDPSTPVRAYEVAAINVDITLNRFLDHDPQGRMYVLEEDLPHVRREEDQNRVRGGVVMESPLCLWGSRETPSSL